MYTFICVFWVSGSRHFKLLLFVPSGSEALTHPMHTQHAHRHTHTPQRVYRSQTAALGVIYHLSEFKVQQDNGAQLGAYRGIWAFCCQVNKY